MDWERFDSYVKAYKPELPKKPKKPVMKEPFSGETAYQFAVEVEQWEKDVESYDDRVRKYAADKKALDEWAKLALLSDVGIVSHPKVDMIWGWAWDKGHASGWYEVYEWLVEIVDFLEEYEKEA
jgi:hypothetical protein